MQAVAFGLANLPYRYGQTQGYCRPSDSGRCGSAPVSTATTLTKFSSSVISLRDRLESLSTSAGLPDGLTSGGSVSGVGAELISKQRGVLEIHTQEGDVVTLNFKNKVSVSVDSQQFNAGGVAISDTSAEVRSYSRISLTVDGDLNAEELAAIEDLVGKVGELTDEFFNGDMDSVLAQAMSLSYDTTQLADFSLDLRLKQSVKAYTYGVQLPPAAAPAASTPTPVESPPVEAATPTPEPVASVPVSEATALPTEAPAVVDGTEDAVANASSATSATQVVADFVAKVRAAFNVSAGDVSMGLSYELKVRLLISSITESAPAEAQPSTEGLECLQQQLCASAC